MGVSQERAGSYEVHFLYLVKAKGSPAIRYKKCTLCQFHLTNQHKQEQERGEIRRNGQRESTSSGMEKLGITHKQSSTFKKVASIQTDILTLPPWKG